MKNLIPLILITFPAIILLSCGGSGDDTTLYDVSVTVSPDGAGTIAPSADSAYEEGEDIQLQAQANEQYLFAGWGGSLESTDNPLSVTVDETYGLTAHFERKDYELAVTTEGEGTVVEQLVESKAREYEHGTVVELIAIPLPDAGYRFVEWGGDLSGSDNPAQITVDEAKEVTAVFEKKDYELAVNTEGSGGVFEQVVSKAKDYEYGDVVELSPAPAEGWEFVEWAGDLSGSDNPAQITVDTAKAVTAVFERKSFALDPDIQGEGSIAKDPDRSEYKYGDTVTLTGEPDENWSFKEWAGEISGTTSEIDITVHSQRDITAVFEEKTYDLTVNTEGEGSVTEEAVQAKSYNHGTSVELSADPADGWRFVEWSGDLESSDNPAEITVDDPKEVTAIFERTPHDLTVLTEGEGTVSEEVVESKAKEYEHGAVVELTASPAEDWEFAGWQGDWSGSDNPAQITVDSPKEVTAIFEQQSSFFLAENGVTIRCPEAEVGRTGVVNGLTYTKRTASQITPDNAAATCTSGITDMTGLFDGASGFNEDISHWDVGSVTNMSGMFNDASSFNGDIGEWDVSSVTDMSDMFRDTDTFNGDLSSWDVSSVTDMNEMFEGASSFNQDLDGWDVSSVTDMSGMFTFADAFNGDLSGWDVSSVTDMEGMFHGAVAFNGDISGWDVSSVTDMSFMFISATSFDQNLSGWCVSDIDFHIDFSFDAGFEGDDDKMPVWGTCPE